MVSESKAARLTDVRTPTSSHVHNGKQSRATVRISQRTIRSEEEPSALGVGRYDETNARLSGTRDPRGLDARILGGRNLYFRYCRRTREVAASRATFRFVSIIMSPDIGRSGLYYSTHTHTQEEFTETMPDAVSSPRPGRLIRDNTKT